MTEYTQNPESCDECGATNFLSRYTVQKDGEEYEAVLCRDCAGGRSR